MGFITGSIRLFYLTQLKSDLEYKLMLINEAKLDAARSVNELMNVGTDLDSESPVIKNMKARREKMRLIEKEFEAKEKEYVNKLKAVEQEIGQVQGLIDKDIQNSFKYK